MNAIREVVIEIICTEAIFVWENHKYDLYLTIGEY